MKQIFNTEFMKNSLTATDCRTVGDTINFLSQFPNNMLIDYHFKNNNDNTHTTATFELYDSKLFVDINGHTCADKEHRELWRNGFAEWKRDENGKIVIKKVKAIRIGCFYNLVIK